MSSKRVVAVALVLCLVALFSSELRAQEGGMDWAEGVITAIGIGVPPPNLRHPAQGRAMARRAAVADAQRNLLEILQGVNVDAETTVENAMANDVIRTRVKGVLRGARPVGNPNYLEDGSVEITYAVSTRGDLADILLPKEGFSPAPPPPPPSEAPAVPETVFTGLIVDARGLSLSPAMAPKVVDEDDAVVYGAKVVDREAAVENGIAIYEKGMDTAKESDRVGKNPIVVKGTKAVGRNKTNVVVSSTDAETVREGAKGQAFLSQCRVIVVVD